MILVWLALAWVVAVSLYYLVDWFVRQVQGVHRRGVSCPPVVSAGTDGAPVVGRADAGQRDTAAAHVLDFSDGYTSSRAERGYAFNFSQKRKIQ